MHIVAWAGAVLWFAIAYFEPTNDTRVRVGFGVFGFGYLVAVYVPILLKGRHVKAQNRLLDRCRALFIVGARAAEAGKKDEAERTLQRIRRLERLWRLGHSMLFRASLALWAVAWGTAICVGARGAGLVFMHYWGQGISASSAAILDEMKVAVALSISAPVWALISYLEGWSNPWSIDDSGDRLARLLFGTREIGVRSNRRHEPLFDGLTPREIFGLGPGFTLRELNRARRSLARNLHPDLNDGAVDKSAREEAMKRVNAAYDVLRREVA